MARWMAVLAALFLFAPAPAPAAADPYESMSVASLQALLKSRMDGKWFGLTNERGREGQPGSWYMRRSISEVVIVKRCVVRFVAPIINDRWPASMTVAGYYGVEWAHTFDIHSEGGGRLTFRAAHMAANETGELQFDTKAQADDFAKLFRALIRKCR